MAGTALWPSPPPSLRQRPQAPSGEGRRSSSKVCGAASVGAMWLLWLLLGSAGECGRWRCPGALPGSEGACYAWRRRAPGPPTASSRRLVAGRAGPGTPPASPTISIAPLPSPWPAGHRESPALRLAGWAGR